jgi:hypothetical protein
MLSFLYLSRQSKNKR